MHPGLTHSRTGPLDRRRVVAPSGLHDHWPCPKRHPRAEPDIDFQLADPGMSRTTSWSLPFRPVIRSVTCSGVDDQTECFMCRCRFSQTTYVSKYRYTSVTNSDADASLLSLVTPVTVDNPHTVTLKESKTVHSPRHDRDADPRPPCLPCRLCAASSTGDL